MASASAKAGGARGAGGGGPDPSIPPSPFEARVPAAGAAHP